MQTDKDSLLSKVLSILMRVTDSKYGITAVELANELNLPKPSVYRLLSQLNELGLLKRDPVNKGQLPGDVLQQLALNVLSQSIHAAPRKAILQQLSQEVGETCNMTYLDGKDLIYFDRVETDWPIKIQLPLGSRVPLYCTASGKLFLANMGKAKQKFFIESLDRQRHTQRTIVDADQLEQELEKIKKSGVGIDNEEFLKGMVAIAVPIINQDNQILYTIAIHAPVLRKSLEELRQYLPALRQAAAQISNSLRI